MIELHDDTKIVITNEDGTQTFSGLAENATKANALKFANAIETLKDKPTTKIIMRVDTELQNDPDSSNPDA